MIAGIFWVAAAVIVYTYAIYPLWVVLRGSRRAGIVPHETAEIEPAVTMVIAAYNEAACIAAKLANTLALDYPRQRLQVIVASDGSTDRTNEIVSRFAAQGIRLLALPRQGKAAALNAAVAASTGEILVFSDANSMYARDAIRALVRPFADARVGGAAGDQRYLEPASAGLSTDGERSYWNFDRLLKVYQSRAGHVISATGAIYAIRRSLFCPIPPAVVDDFFVSTGVIAQGHRLVFARDAIAYEPVAGSSEIEFGRKVRTIILGFRAVLVRRSLLNPFRHGFYSIQLISHKILRRLMFLPLLLLLVTNLMLATHNPLFLASAAAQVAFYGCALLGTWLGRTRTIASKLFTLPFYFCMVNAAALLAAWNVLLGRKLRHWETQRRPKDAGVAVRSSTVSLEPDLVNS